jgi:hypothetical protein
MKNTEGGIKNPKYTTTVYSGFFIENITKPYIFTNLTGWF